MTWSSPDLGSGTLVKYQVDAFENISGGPSVASCETSTQTCNLTRPEASRLYYYSVKAVTTIGVGAETSPRISAVPISNFVPNDARYNEQWYMDGDYGVNATEAWQHTIGSSEIIVGVIDTGITFHEDLQQNLVSGYDFISQSLNARDGGGRDSDPTDMGDWNGTSSSSWHGTHVTGIIGAVGGNSIGITGIAPGVRIQPLRVLGANGGLTSDLVAAITWGSGGNVPGIASNSKPSSVLNLSLGGDGFCSLAEQDAISAAVLRGTTIVVAAGNEDQNAMYSTPGNCSGVITVAASNADGEITDYSNYGSVVEIMAPGGQRGIDSGIISTLNSGVTAPASSSYGNYEGTSMAAPIVAGIVALIKSVNKSFSPAQISEIISNSYLPDTQCSSSYACGPGIIDAGEAVRLAKER